MSAVATSEVALVAEEDASFVREMLARIAFIKAFGRRFGMIGEVRPSCAGREALALGARAALRDDDQIIATSCGLAWAIASGIDGHALLSTLRQKVVAVSQNGDGSAFVVASSSRLATRNLIMGAGAMMACGVALANAMRDSRSVVVVTIGDGTLGLGSIQEAFGFACMRHLALIFVVERDGRPEPVGCQGMVDCLVRDARRHGISTVTIDGADPVAVRDAFDSAAGRARRGDGPSVVECRILGSRVFLGPDTEHDPRLDADGSMADRDPFTILRTRLIASGVLRDVEVDAILAEQEEALDVMTRASIDGLKATP